MSALEEMVRPSLARIVAPRDGYAPDRDGYWGSGFFVAPGWLLTCAHVVAEGGAAVWRGESAVGVTWQGGLTTGEVVLAKPRPEAADSGRRHWGFPDVALVRVPAAVQARCVWLSDRAPVLGTPVSSHGWSRQTGDLGVRHVTGEIEGFDGRALVLKGGRLADGLSGGPVVDLRHGTLVGMNKGRNEHEGAAMAVTALRELFDVRGGDVLHTVVREHDLHHLERFTDGTADDDWTTVQSGLPGYAATGVTPELRVHLYGHFAHLPPPGRSGEVMTLVHRVRRRVTGERQPSPILHEPRTWREGAGLLLGLRDRRARSRAEAELDAVLLYAAEVARHTVEEHPASVDRERLRAFADWITEQSRRYAHWAARDTVDSLLRGLFITTRRAEPRLRADVLVSVGDRVYGDLYPWSVQLLYDGQDVTPVAGDDRGVPLAGLYDAVREPLLRALRQGDQGEHLAAVEVFLPRRLFDLPVDEWRLVPEEGRPRDDGRTADEDATTPATGPATGPGPDAGGMDEEAGADYDDADYDDADFDFDEDSVPLGLRRTVVIRDLKRSTRAPSPEWRKRWNGVRRGPLTHAPLRAEAPAEGHPPGARRESGVAAYGRLSTLEDGHVAVHCGPVTGREGREAMAAALTAGHAVLLWRRDAHDHADCAAFHRQAARVLELAGRAEGLHRPVRELRISLADPDTASTRGLKGKIAVMFDPPDRPAHGTEAMQPPPLVGPDN
ncbi:trypsin-like peptidase domain-containing protein [Streptomyces sp. NPDC093094]|uniref:VMAP-C domain-containing protein n=1 Tax=Streptomyces sp. NPDC093094 TaxID=3366026 RepID=UPI003828873B